MPRQEAQAQYNLERLPEETGDRIRITGLNPLEKVERLHSLSQLYYSVGGDLVDGGGRAQPAPAPCELHQIHVGHG